MESEIILEKKTFFGFFKKLNKKKSNVEVGDEGIYQDLLTYYNQHHTGDIVKHNVFTKVKVLQVFDGLVEVEILDTEISQNAHPCVIELAKANIGKYLDPDAVKWNTKK